MPLLEPEWPAPEPPPEPAPPPWPPLPPLPPWLPPPPPPPPLPLARAAPGPSASTTIARRAAANTRISLPLVGEDPEQNEKHHNRRKGPAAHLEAAHP